MEKEKERELKSVKMHTLRLSSRNAQYANARYAQRTKQYLSSFLNSSLSIQNLFLQLKHTLEDNGTHADLSPLQSWVSLLIRIRVF